MDFIEAHVVFENAAFAYRNTSLFNSLPIHEEWFLNEYLKRGLSFIESYCSSDENRNELMRAASLFSQKLETLDEFKLFGEIPRKCLDKSEPLANRTLFPEPVERESVTTLFIIGNGFDLDHDMPTGFSHFKSYIETCAEYISEGLLAISGYSDVKPEDMWFEFERYMEGLNTDYLNDYNEDKVTELVSYGSDEFRDRDNHTLEHYYSMDLSWIDGLKEAFCTWINSVTNPEEAKYVLDKHRNLFVSFNYTFTLEETYQIPPERVVHLHGAGDSDKTLLMGHRKKPNSMELGMSESGNDVRIYNAYEQCSRYIEEFFKPVEAIADRLESYLHSFGNIEQVIVLGHSYNEIDKPYFKTISNVFPRAEYTFSVFNEDDNERLHELLASIGNLNFEIIESYNEILPLLQN